VTLPGTVCTFFFPRSRGTVSLATLRFLVISNGPLLFFPHFVVPLPIREDPAAQLRFLLSGTSCFPCVSSPFFLWHIRHRKRPWDREERIFFPRGGGRCGGKIIWPPLFLFRRGRFKHEFSWCSGLRKVLFVSLFPPPGVPGAFLCWKSALVFFFLFSFFIKRRDADWACPLGDGRTKTSP